MKYPQITVIIPTYNESGNIIPLVREIENALTTIDWAIIFVDDDSNDGTILEIERCVYLNQRIEGVLRRGVRGLSGAVLTGLMYARSPFVAVMDADLQHDPRLIKTMLNGLEANPSKEIALASRYLDSYTGNGLSKTRYIGSRVLTKISQLFIAKNLTDPMSGFFLVRRELFSKLSPKLSPNGYKILLDLVSGLQPKNGVLEYPLIFRARNSGESKMDFRVIWELLVIIIYRSSNGIFPRHFLSFIMIGLIGLSIHLILLFILFKLLGLSFAISQIVATLIAMLNNFLLNNYLTYCGNSLAGNRLISGYLKFTCICCFGGFLSFIIANYLMSNGGIWFIAGSIGAIASAGWNYSLTKFITWSPKRPEIIWLRH
jgi:dolichol-phosphate mannosyltransferase